MYNKSLPTVDEIINSLKRSYLPTILIEGTDDVFIYRWLKSKLSTTLVSLQACGGRNNLFSIHDRREEFADKNVVFVADRDAYKFTGVPEFRSSIIFTSGYCIENDIYTGSNIDEFIDDEDRQDHQLLKEIIGKWFAFEVGRYQIDLEASQEAALTVATHINVVSPIGLRAICPKYATEIGYIEPDENILRYVTNDYDLNIRGKQLFQMLSRFLSKKGRFSSFSDKNLIEVALKQGENNYIDKLVSDINLALTAS
ncbi:MAG: DUF4435 domain-containing protein [Reinekea sp.]